MAIETDILVKDTHIGDEEDIKPNTTSNAIKKFSKEHNIEEEEVLVVHLVRDITTAPVTKEEIEKRGGDLHIKLSQAISAGKKALLFLSSC